MLRNCCDERLNLPAAQGDGQRETRLFYLSGGCSLTLRGLTLVNGRAEYGGVVKAQHAGDIEIIDSTVRDCSAVVVRFVELVAELVAALCSATLGEQR